MERTLREQYPAALQSDRNAMLPRKRTWHTRRCVENSWTLDEDHQPFLSYKQVESHPQKGLEKLCTYRPTIGITLGGHVTVLYCRTVVPGIFSPRCFNPCDLDQSCPSRPLFACCVIRLVNGFTISSLLKRSVRGNKNTYVQCTICNPSCSNENK